MRILAFTLMWFAGAVVFAGDAAKTTVYKWVDENGVVHYSDQPHENSQKVDVRAPQTYTPARPVNTTSRPDTRDSSAVPHRTCAITQPTDEQMLMNAFSVTVNVQVSPPPGADERISLLMDGQRVQGLASSGSSFTLSPIDRGTHSIQLVLQDGSGQVVCQSPSVTFHVEQPSIANPARPVHPK